MTDIFEQLAAPFPEEKIHWRAQSLTQDGNKAMALAYVDARDVMGRLDEVVGPENWKDTYRETPTGRVICRLHVRVKGEWTWKEDGAGSTQMEGEKGGISDAFKRAGVKWKIARYLYDMPAPWVPCEYYERNGKKHWKKWKESPWSYAKAAMKHPNGVRPGDESGADKVKTDKLADIPRNEEEWKAWAVNAFKPAVDGCKTVAALDKIMSGMDDRLKALKHASPNYHKHLIGIANSKRSDLEKTELTPLDAG